MQTPRKAFAKKIIGSETSIYSVKKYTKEAK
jgi:hypothetical protein